MSWIGDVAPTRDSSRLPVRASQTDAFVDAADEAVSWSRASAQPIEPAAAMREPSGLTASAAVAGVRIVSTTREAASARWSASTASGSGAPWTLAFLTACDREQDAQLRVDVQVRHRGRRQLPCGRDPRLLLRAVALVEGVRG